MILSLVILKSEVLIYLLQTYIMSNQFCILMLVIYHGFQWKGFRKQRLFISQIASTLSMHKNIQHQNLLCLIFLCVWKILRDAFKKKTAMRSSYGFNWKSCLGDGFDKWNWARNRSKFGKERMHSYHNRTGRPSYNWRTWKRIQTVRKDVKIKSATFSYGYCLILQFLYTQNMWGRCFLCTMWHEVAWFRSQDVPRHF